MPTVSSGQTVTVSSGTTSGNWAVDSGGTLDVFGSSPNDAVSGALNVFAGGVISGVTVYSGAALTISSGGTGTGTLVVGTETVAFGGTEFRAKHRGWRTDFRLRHGVRVAPGPLWRASTEYIESGGVDSGSCA